MQLIFEQHVVLIVWVLMYFVEQVLAKPLVPG